MFRSPMFRNHLFRNAEVRLLSHDLVISARRPECKSGRLFFACLRVVVVMNGPAKSECETSFGRHHNIIKMLNGMNPIEYESIE